MSVKDGEHVSRYFAKRNCFTATMRSGCEFADGIIVEVEANAFDAALDLADAFEMVYDIEQ